MDALFEPWSPAFVADPYPAYERLRADGRVHWFEPTRQWLVPHYADVSALLRDRRLGRTYLHRFSHEEFGRTAPPPEHEPFHTLNDNGILDLEAPDHTRIRRLVTKAFTPRTVAALEPTVRRLAAELVAGLKKDGGGDLLADIAEPLPVAVIAEMLGIPEPDRYLLRPWSADICGMFELNPSEETARKAVTASVEFSAYLRTLIAQRRTDPGEDLISALIAAYDEGDRLSEQEMISTCVLLLNAGHEATVNTTANGWWTLFRHPEQLAALRADHALLPTAVEELMRFDTPLQMFERWVLDDIEIGGTVVPRGAELALLFGSANRDPERFDDPDRLDLSRTDNPHITFGAGIHFCLGAPLARIELAASFGELLREAPTMRLAGEPEWKPGYVIRGVHALPVEL
ncbi:MULTISPECIES: cytochrome P450 [Streptomyces]|uniref:Cytochrome P450 n=1 Tax=Streptomyces tsukubensis (strain DSM 42081 / NBRC 108919 / NRRL 18488 / 9993) TaxID=1114943 RepID=I2N2V1_STRT9|nr:MULTISPECIES: cytochrome P450 [Streptomyces]AZK95467.1 cytochrome P450 [Streptomyces tsukubensis]EIF91348.1 cytochrome P450 [Streptomyces tsukubensis NRRL18488]MYS66624.1 cytochrome P450 [Streptomyces sp. SID5473]QKM68490.1 cytochrome P450 [Streptomyces tsukubensis NRRL18488]TAI43302.1 cytochrome P450 [Streptomyces tsukubensis]